MLTFTNEAREALLNTAIDCYSTGRFPEAEAILLGVTAAHPDEVRAWMLLGSTLMLQDRHTEAEQVYERAYALNPEDPYTLVSLGELKLNALKIDEAIALFGKLFAADPERKHPAANRGRKLVAEAHARLSQR